MKNSILKKNIQHHLIKSLNNISDFFPGKPVPWGPVKVVINKLRDRWKFDQNLLSIIGNLSTFWWFEVSFIGCRKRSNLRVDSNQRLNYQGFIGLEQPLILYTCCKLEKHFKNVFLFSFCKFDIASKMRILFFQTWWSII